jgi:7,8-dihydroneopterin aldolase/epimerase/oxygenase
MSSVLNQTSKEMKNHIEVNGIKLYAFHGCLPEETKIGGHYLVDVSLETNFLKAALEDTLIDTIDYVVINRIVKEEMAIPSKLIEHVGYRIMKRFENEVEGMHFVRIKITKICPPINGDVDNVAIIIEEKY